MNAVQTLKGQVLLSCIYSGSGIEISKFLNYCDIRILIQPDWKALTALYKHIKHLTEIPESPDFWNKSHALV